MSDAMEARGQDVDQEPADELVSWQAHDPHPVGSNHDWKASRPKARHKVADFYTAQMAGCYAAVDKNTKTTISDLESLRKWTRI